MVWLLIPAWIAGWILTVRWWNRDPINTMGRGPCFGNLFIWPLSLAFMTLVTIADSFEDGSGLSRAYDFIMGRK